MNRPTMVKTGCMFQGMNLWIEVPASPDPWKPEQVADHFAWWMKEACRELCGFGLACDANAPTLKPRQPDTVEGSSTQRQ